MGNCRMTESVYRESAASAADYDFLFGLLYGQSAARRIAEHPAKY
jgi:hypothetical protein